MHFRQRGRGIYVLGGGWNHGRPCISWRRKGTTDTAGEGGETVEKIKKAETGVEEKTQTVCPRDAWNVEYQKNANPDSTTLKVLKFLGGEEMRKDQGTDMRRCIQCLVEDKLVQQYQKNSRPDQETREALESSGGTAWREDEGEERRKGILRTVKEEWKSVKPSC